MVSNRKPSLDAARAVALMFVVVTHAALSFMATPIGWAVQDRSQHLGVDLYVWIVRAFAMPTFFWLSGYFSRAVLVHGGIAAFARNRGTRIVVPLAIALVPCSLVVGALWDWGREIAGRAAVADNIPKLEESEVEIFLGHLWFLYYLLALSVVGVGIARLVRRVPARLPILLLPAVLTFGALAHLGALHTNTPLGFVPDLAILTYTGGFFGWGWLVHARPDELARYGRRLGAAAVVALGSLAIVITTLARGLTIVEVPPLYAIAASAVFSIAVMVGLLGACERYLAKPRPVLRFVSDASYWFYVVHLPVVVALQVLLARVAIPGPIKLVAIVSVTTAVCLGVYAIGSRVTRGRRRTASRIIAHQR